MTTAETIAIPALADNVIYMVVAHGMATVIDPGDDAPVARELAARGARLAAVLLTHKHADHTAGAAALKKATACRVEGPSECLSVGLDRTLGEGDIIEVGGLTFDVMATPGHTEGHVCYRLREASCLWTGDTLFVGGCGRIVGGAAQDMWRSLCRIRALPPETMVHTGHDYTQDNIDFAAEILPSDSAIARMKARILGMEGKGKPVTSSTVGDEAAFNIFLRADTDPVRQALGMPGADGARVFAELRRRKDVW